MLSASAIVGIDSVGKTCENDNFVLILEGLEIRLDDVDRVLLEVLLVA